MSGHRTDWNRRTTLPGRLGPVLLTLSLLGAGPAAAVQVVVPDDYATIGDAIDAIVADPQVADTIIVEPGTYEENVSLTDNIIIRGRETARTFITGTGDGPVLSANGVTGTRISNFTIMARDDGTGMLISGLSDITVANNVFTLGGDRTAVLVEGLSTPEFLNNVFFDNGAAIDMGGNALTVRNNAFFNNDLTLTTVPADESGIVNNGFSGNDSDNVFGSGVVSAPPEFVNPDGLDFHLRPGSPYIDVGTGLDALDDTDADIGVYGGTFAEGTPARVEDVSASATAADAISVGWSDNRWYRLGGFKVYYDNDRSGTPYEGDDAAAGASPIDVGDVTTYALEGLSPQTVTPEAPTLRPAEPLDEALALNWSGVSSATGYVVHWGVASTDEHAVDVGNVTRHTLGGLENGTVYRVTVSAYAQPRYFIAVSAYANFGEPPESTLSEEVAATVGPQVDGLPSNEVSDFPEAITPFPDLPDENRCFIATAAYGSYGAFEVRLLRRFRDDYLLTNTPGRAFVAWYYRKSPPLARALEDSAWAKPIVQAALLPAVAAAAFAVHTPAVVKWSVLLLLGLMLLRWRVRRRRPA